MPKNKLTKFYIVRHGETDWNAKKIVQGHIDIPLNDTGEKQAHEVAKKFKNIQFDLVFSSDLIRAKRTAEIITLEKKLVIATTKKLRERRFGMLESKPSAEFFAFINKMSELSHDERLHSRPYDDFETDHEVTTRIITFLREAAVANPGKNVLITTHGGVLRMILLHLGYFDYKTISGYRFHNLSYITVTSDGVDFFVKELNGIEKLKEIH